MAMKELIGTSVTCQSLDPATSVIGGIQVPYSQQMSAGTKIIKKR